MSEAATAAHQEATRRAFRTAWIRNGAIWLSLLFLLATSMAVAFLPLGSWCFPIDLALSAGAALIVGILSMNLDHAPALDRLAAAAGFLFLLVMFTITACDIYNRI